VPLRGRRLGRATWRGDATAGACGRGGESGGAAAAGWEVSRWCRGGAVEEARRGIGIGAAAAACAAACVRARRLLRALRKACPLPMATERREVREVGQVRAAAHLRARVRARLGARVRARLGAWVRARLGAWLGARLGACTPLPLVRVEGVGGRGRMPALWAALATIRWRRGEPIRMIGPAAPSMVVAAPRR
jgi:hypothetical protein